MDERQRLAEEISDPELIRYFYLDQPVEAVLARLDSLKVALIDSQDDVPFNAQVKGYYGARDEEGHTWILKPATDAKEILYHRICSLAYLLDHWTGTLSAPTTVFRIDGKDYRASKVVQKAVQISSYDYLDRPFVDILRADLVNRWIYFDEDRNPNNYLVIQNKAGRPFVAAIDFDKADLTAEQMKITGNHEKFGWFRSEKTRFLTLLRPDNFDGVPLETFQARLEAFEAIDEARLAGLTRSLVDGWCDNPTELSATLVSNLLARRAYVDAYFRSMFKPACETVNCGGDDYSMLGASFVAMHQGKK